MPMKFNTYKQIHIYQIFNSYVQGRRTSLAGPYSSFIGIDSFGIKVILCFWKINQQIKFLNIVFLLIQNCLKQSCGRRVADSRRGGTQKKLQFFSFVRRALKIFRFGILLIQGKWISYVGNCNTISPVEEICNNVPGEDSLLC